MTEDRALILDLDGPESPELLVVLHMVVNGPPRLWGACSFVTISPVIERLGFLANSTLRTFLRTVTARFSMSGSPAEANFRTEMYSPANLWNLT